MANIVRVSTEGAQRSRDSLMTNLEEANAQIDSLLTAVQGTREWWEGETTEAFIGSFESAVQAFKKYLQKLQMHGDAMVNSVERQHSHDQSLARNIKRY